MKSRPLLISEQLDLELAGPGLAWREPWGGRSARVLTRSFKLFTLSALPPGGLRPNEEVRQLHMQKGWSAPDQFLFF